MALIDSTSLHILFVNGSDLIYGVSFTVPCFMNSWLIACSFT